MMQLVPPEPERNTNRQLPRSGLPGLQRNHVDAWKLSLMGTAHTNAALFRTLLWRQIRWPPSAGSGSDIAKKRAPWWQIQANTSSSRTVNPVAGSLASPCWMICRTLFARTIDVDGLQGGLHHPHALHAVGEVDIELVHNLLITLPWREDFHHQQGHFPAAHRFTPPIRLHAWATRRCRESTPCHRRTPREFAAEIRYLPFPPERRNSAGDVCLHDSEWL